MSILVVDIERETAVLFAMFGKPELIALSGLEADDFVDDASRGVFALLSERLEDGRSVTTAEELFDAIEESHNADALRPFIDRAGEGRWVWSSGVRGFDHHVRKLKELRWRRSVLRYAGRLESAVAGPAQEIGEALETGRDEILELHSRFVPAPEARCLSSLYADDLDGNYVQLGWSKLDRAFGGGVPRGDVLTIVGAPSVGKTTFALETILRVLRSHPDDAVMFWSLEMPSRQVVMRHLMSFAGLRKWELDRCIEGADSWPEGKAVEDFDRLTEGRYFVWSREAPTLDVLIARAAALKQPIALLVVDYLQLVPVKGTSTEYAQVTEVARRLKNVARDLDCAVLALSQVNRGVESLSQCPTLRQARGSGAIEEAADFLVAAWRPGYENEREDATVVQFATTIWKNRHGHQGRVDYGFDLPRQSVRDVPSGATGPVADTEPRLRSASAAAGTS